MHEAQSLAAILDEMLHSDINTSSMLFEKTARRLAAVEAADKYNNWDLANTIDITGGTGAGLLPLAALDGYARNITRVNSLYRRGFGVGQQQQQQHVAWDNNAFAPPQQQFNNYGQQQPVPQQQQQQQQGQQQQGQQQQQPARNFSRGPWATTTNNNNNNNMRGATRARSTSTVAAPSAGPSTGISNAQ